MLAQASIHVSARHPRLPSCPTVDAGLRQHDLAQSLSFTPSAFSATARNSLSTGG